MVANKEIIDFYKNNPTISIKDAALHLKMNANTLQNRRNYLAKKGFLKKQDSNQKHKVEHLALKEECDRVGIPIDDTKNYWYKGKHFSIHASRAETNTDYFAIRDELYADMKKFAPKYPIIKRPKKKDSCLLTIDAADPHFGKRSTIMETGEETNLSTTEKRFSEGVQSLIYKTDGYNFDKIIFIGGNDSLHTDNPFGTTTAGTKQDTAGMWYENFLCAKKAYISALDKLLTISDVHFVFCPSNHDFMTGFFLADTLKSWYSNNKNITFDNDPIHRKYVHYGHSLLGFTHGDGCKEADLSDLMKTEAKKAWSESQYGYWYVHHRHHSDRKAWKGSSKIKMEKDYKNLTVFNTGLNMSPQDYCFVEYVRSMSGTDRWHFTNGFAHAPQAMEAFITHPQYGQINKITHLY